MHIGLEQAQQRVDVELRKHDDVVHGPQRADELGPVGGGQDGTPRPLERPHRLVAVDGDDQPVGLRLGTLQVADVADVEHIEAAVGQRDRSPRLPFGRDRIEKRVACQNPRHPPGPCS